MERMELKKKSIMKILSNYCFYTEIRDIIKRTPPHLEPEAFLDLKYYDELFKDILADVFCQKENDKKAKLLGNQLQMKFINTPKEMKLEEYNFLIGLFKSFFIMTKPTTKQAEKLTQNIDVFENGRGYFIFNDFNEIQQAKYVTDKTAELRGLEDYLTDLLVKHMGDKFGMGGVMMNTRSGQIREF